MMIRGFGAQPINYQTASADDYLAASPSGEEFDTIFDTVGGRTLDQSFQSVRPYKGHVVSILGWGTHKPGAAQLPRRHLLGGLHPAAAADRTRPRPSRADPH
jgi:NADPH:quinone reductase-like Zn-dependent oxidoreductase